MGIHKETFPYLSPAERYVAACHGCNLYTYGVKKACYGKSNEVFHPGFDAEISRYEYKAVHSDYCDALDRKFPPLSCRHSGNISRRFG